MDLTILPAINATLNGISGILLILGFREIRQKNIAKHKKIMISAFVISIVFLLCYLLHKYLLFVQTGQYNTAFNGEGFWRFVYFFILITHVTLAASVPVLAIITIKRGLIMNVELHKKIAKITYPIWMYVSVTGVIVYLMLYQLFPAH